jgi:hypothetical protein
MRLFLASPALRALLCAVPVLVGVAMAPVSAATATPAAKASNACLVEVLGELGWRLERADVARLSIAAGLPCEWGSVAEAHARGALRGQLPAAAADSRPLRRDLVRLFADPATHCGFSFLLGDATRTAVDRLVGNKRFRFSSLQAGWIGFGAGGAARDGWEPIRSLGRGFRPRSNPSAAIEGFYSGSVRAECGVGRQIAQYASLRELFGPRDFDAVFSRDEIVVGTFRQLGGSASVLLGSSAGEFSRDGRAVRAARQGRQAFSGLPGFIFHVFDASTLDDADNQAENFVVYAVSDAAARSLRESGGFETFNLRARELWELSRSLDLISRRSYERILHERDASLRARLPPRKRRVIERMDAILADPFFREFEIYVHPVGVKPLAYHFARLLDLNPRTPFRIELALHNLHTTIYARWVDQRLAHCEARERSAESGAGRGTTPVD